MNNFSTRLPPFVGRKDELAQIAALLDDPACRLLTLVGPGGIGKTRLAVEATAPLTKFPHGIFFVGLQALKSSDSIVGAIAAAVDFQFYPGGEPEQQLLDFLRDKCLLLILDNFEHLLEDVEPVSQILAHTPQVRLLATSRERLNLLEEWVLEVTGLPFPATNADREIADYGAVELFLQSARRAQVGFAPTGTESEAIAHICRLLGGMPLAIELAAPWVHALSCAEIAREIERSLDILESPARNVEPRHRNMRAAFEPTWNGLTDDERELFTRLSIFRGGCTREAAEQVAGATLKTLSSLVNKSLLRKDASGRYDMHELLRQYAEERLRASPEAANALSERHGVYYAQFMEDRVETMVSDSRRLEITGEVEADLENIRRAWDWAVEYIRPYELLQSAHTLITLFYYRNLYQMGSQMYGAAIRRLESGPINNETWRALAEVMTYQSWICIRTGQLRQAKTLLERSRALYADFRAAPRPLDASDPLPALSLLATITGDYSEGERLGMLALEQAESHEDQYNTVFACYVLASAAGAQGHYRDAQQHARQAYRLTQELTWRWMMAYCLNEWGNADRQLGNYVEARLHYQESFAIRGEFNDREGMAEALNLLGDLALIQGEYQDAGKFYRESLAIYQETGDRGFLASAYSGLGTVACALGDYQAASISFSKAVQATHEANLIPQLLSVLIGCGELLVQVGRVDQAAELLALVYSHPITRQDTRDKAGQLLARYPVQLAASRKAGNDLDAAIVRVLSELRQVSQATTQEPSPVKPLPEYATLTERELEILRLAAQGLTNQQIAASLFFAVGTVKWYLHEINAKLDVGNRTQAIARARELRLLS